LDPGVGEPGGPLLAGGAEALRAQPEFGRAQLGLGTALAALGDFTGARAHLGKAASNANPAVRQEAAELLQALQAERK
ncbi:MAG: hypothetical protein HYR60_15050, partial [Acidobacteria bacterium]|nr:hypothetical protein [Acidobacteriota bacterium]